MKAPKIIAELRDCAVMYIGSWEGELLERSANMIEAVWKENSGQKARDEAGLKKYASAEDSDVITRIGLAIRLSLVDKIEAVLTESIVKRAETP